MDKNRFSRMYGYGSNDALYLRRIKEFRRIQITRTIANRDMKVQDPPKEATLSAKRCPKVDCSERS
jgi:hypothetical protein